MPELSALIKIAELYGPIPVVLGVALWLGLRKKSEEKKSPATPTDFSDSQKLYLHESVRDPIIDAIRERRD